MKAVFSLILLLIISLGFGQSSFIRTYGSSDFNYGKGILALPDTSYIICGNRSFNGSNGSIWLFRVDSLGAFIWEKYINQYDAAFVEDIAWFDDTSFVICGTVLENNDYNVFAARYSISGNKIWEQTVGTPSWDYSKAIVSDSSYTLWITGYTTPYDTFNTDAFIYTLNGINGDSLSYTRFDFSYTDIGNYIDTFASSLVFITESTDLNADSCISTVWFMDKSLNEIWHINFGSDSVDYNIYCSGRDTYSRLWIAGGFQHDTAAKEYFFYALIDTSKIIIFDRHGTIQGNKYSRRMVINDHSVVYTIGPTNDGYLNFGNSDFGLVIDNSGSGSTRYYGELQNDYGEDIDLSLDGGLVMIGSTENYANNISSILLIKVDSTLTYNDTNYIHYAAISENKLDQQLFAYPNPSNSIFNFELNFQYSAFTVSDLFGRIIKKGYSLPGNTLDLSQEPSGIYFLSLYSIDRIHTIKLFLQK